MTPKDVVGTSLLFFAGLSAAVIVTFLLLYVVPSHPGVEQHEEIMNFLMPVVHSDTSFLTEEELQHMWDVKAWLFGFIILGIICVFVLKKKDFVLQKRYAGYGLLLPVVFFLGMSLKGFSSAFVRFHHIFFPQGGWQFPAESVLITLYPETYFVSVGFILLGCVLGVAAFLIGNFKIPGIKE